MSTNSPLPSAPKGLTLKAEITSMLRISGGEEKKKMSKNTSEAGMSMKTKEHKTQCPNRNRLIVARFRHLRLTGAHFAEKCRFGTTVCQTHSVFRGLLGASYTPFAK
jgi:hypothetical protein